MALPSVILTEIAREAAALDVWLEVEGMPYGFGLTEMPASAFSGRTNYEQRIKGVLPLLVGVPDGIEQEVRPWDGDASVGQLTARILLDDGGVVRGLLANVARRDGWGRLGADLAAPAAMSGAPSTVDIVVNGAMPGVSFTPPAAGQPIYCGRETWEYVSTPVAGTFRVYRGMYQPNGTLTRQDYAHTAGDIVSTYPRFLATRRVYMRCRPLAGGSEFIRWAGTIRGAKLVAGLNVLELTMDSVEADLLATLFSGQIRGKLSNGISAPDGSMNPPDGDPVSLVNRARLEKSSISGRTWVQGERILFRVGDEVISGRLQITSGISEIHFDNSLTYPEDGRGLFGTTGAEHAVGDDIAEVFSTIAYRSTGNIEERTSKFSQGDNPVNVALQILLSRKGDGANGTYDVLPEGRGLGLSKERVDVTGWTAIRDRWLPSAREIRFIEGPYVAKELLASILRTHLCYPTAMLDDLLGLRFIGPPMPDASPRALSGTHVVGLPDWTSNIDTVIGRVIMRADYDPVAGEFRQTYVGQLQGPGIEAQEFYANLYETLEVEFPGQWSGNDPASARWGARLTTDAEAVALRYFDGVKDRLGRPFPSLDIECQYDALDVEVGDLISLTLDGAPDVTLGTTGLAAVTCEVRRKVVDDRRGIVTFTVVQTDYRHQYRLIAPSAVVASSATSNTVSVNAHEFTDPNGTVNDADLFPVGCAITIYNVSLGLVRGTSGRTVTARTSTSLTFDGTAITFTAGDLIVLSRYDTQPATGVVDRYAFLGGGNPTILGSVGGTDIPPHEYAP